VSLFLKKWVVQEEDRVERLQLENNPSYDLDPLAVKCNNKPRVA
jgi:hypothetical protein